MVDNHMDVSENSGTPKPSISVGFSITNHPFWGTPIFGNTHIAWFIYVYMYMMIYLDAFDNLCFPWRLGLPKKDGHMLWTKKLKTRDARFQNKHLHCSSVLELKFFWRAGMFICWVGTLPRTNGPRTNGKIGLSPCPKRDLDRPIPIIWLLFSYIFNFHPYLRKIPILTNIFSKAGLKPPTRSCFFDLLS